MSKPKRDFSRKSREIERKTLYVIATEGEKTEKMYFEALQQRYRQNIRVEVLPTKKGKSAPEQVIKRLKGYQNKCSLKPEDELWLLIDGPEWGEKLDEIASECKRLRYFLAVSNPSFEFWLQLHQNDLKAPATIKECEAQLKRLLGIKYEKSSYNVNKLLPCVNQAILYAKTLHQNKSEPYPFSPGTHVYLLVSELIGCIDDELIKQVLVSIPFWRTYLLKISIKSARYSFIKYLSQ